MPNGFDNQNTNQPGGYNTSGPGWGGDFSGNLNNMMAPPPGMAQQMNNPYATMSQNSWLARNHPQVAGVLDNAFLSGAMTPQAQGPEGVGGGLSRAFQGLLGAQQFQRQKQIQNAMLPYQMMQPRLAAMDTMSQINERNAMIPFRMSQENRMNAQSDMYMNRITQGDRAKVLSGQDRVSDDGKTWSRVFDPISGRTSLVDNDTGKSSQELGVTPSFTKEERNQRMSTPGGLLGETYDMMNSPDPAVRIKGTALHQQYISDQQLIAGARAAGSSGVTQPQADIKALITREQGMAYRDIPKIPSSKDFQSSMIDNAAAQDPEAQKQVSNYFKDPAKAYENEVKRISGIKQQVDVNFSKYQKSSAPKFGVSYSEYMNNQSMYDGSAPNPAPAQTSGTGSNWNPK